MGITVSLDFYRREYSKALRNGSDAMLAFRTKLLNVYSEDERKSWISSTLARKISKPINLDSISGRPAAMVALDLSERDDFSAVTVGMYNDVKKSFSFHTSYFFPEGALKEHPNEKLYRVWADRGYLNLTPGDVIDYRTIVDYIVHLNEKVSILGIGYDAWKSQDVINMLAAVGANKILRAVSQTYGNFTAPVQAFEHGVYTNAITINDNPINAYCFGNAVLDVDSNENTKPIKRQRTHKIDGVITMLMCLRLFMDYER
jgi:phage terminase large subunit-like protein